MIENKSHYKLKSATERNFGLVFGIIFFIIFLYPYLFGNDLHTWALVVSIIFIFFGIFIPKVLILPNRLWFKLGNFIGGVVSPITMGLIFFLTVTPTGIIMRLLGKDILKQNLDKSVNSYWVKRKETDLKDNSMKNQF